MNNSHNTMDKSDLETHSKSDLRRHKRGDYCQCGTGKTMAIKNPSWGGPPVIVKIGGPSQVREYYVTNAEGHDIYLCKTCDKVCQPKRGIGTGVRRAMRNKYHPVRLEFKEAKSDGS